MSQTTEFTNIKEVLESLGVTDRTLRAEQKKHLDEQGYIVLPDMIDRAWLGQLRDTYEQLLLQERQEIGYSPRQESGTRHLDGLVGRSEVFELIYTSPRLLAAVYHILGGEFRATGMHGRDPLPGFGQQGLHADWTAPVGNGPFVVANSIWMLDDFTLTNGATRVVPESHRQTQRVPKPMSQPNSSHPQQVLVTGQAGSVLVFNSHLWHSGTTNRSKSTRRSIQCFFVAREQTLYSEQAENRPAEQLKRLPPAARYILNIKSV